MLRNWSLRIDREGKGWTGDIGWKSIKLMVGLILGCWLVIVGEGGGNGYPVTVGIVVEVEVDSIELLFDGWELKRDDGKRNRGGK